MLLTLCLLILLYAASINGSESCRNFPGRIRPKLFREGDWIDQVRVFSGSGDFVSHHHPKDTASLFLANWHTNCGHFELKIDSDNRIELFKGYYASRFQEHFYPFVTTITHEDSSALKCKMRMEKLHCDNYLHLKTVVENVNVLNTDYSSFMVLHQCVDNRNYLMLLTRSGKFDAEDRSGVEKLLVDIMRDYEIVIENQTFWWPTPASCDKLMGEIFPAFYRKIYYERSQPECLGNLTVELVDLRDYWKDKVENDERLYELRKTVVICSIIMVLGTAAIVGAFAIFLDNYKP